MDAVLRDAIFLIKLSELLDQDWFKIGIFLNVEERSLEAIKADFINFPKQEDKANGMIKKWFNIDQNPTFEKLRLAIIKIPNCKLLKEVEDLAKGFSTMPPILSKGAPNPEIDIQYPLTPDIVDIVASSIGVNFESFGLHLGLSPQVISNITFDRPTVHAKAVAVITNWTEKNEILKWEQLKKELLLKEYKLTVKKIDDRLRNKP